MYQTFYYSFPTCKKSLFYNIPFVKSISNFNSSPYRFHLLNGRKINKDQGKDIINAYLGMNMIIPDIEKINKEN